jgi:hypothetical protein
MNPFAAGGVPNDVPPPYDGLTDAVEDTIAAVRELVDGRALLTQVELRRVAHVCSTADHLLIGEWWRREGEGRQ